MHESCFLYNFAEIYKKTKKQLKPHFAESLLCTIVIILKLNFQLIIALHCLWNTIHLEIVTPATFFHTLGNIKCITFNSLILNCRWLQLCKYW